MYHQTSNAKPNLKKLYFCQSLTTLKFILVYLSPENICLMKLLKHFFLAAISFTMDNHCKIWLFAGWTLPSDSSGCVDKTQPSLKQLSFGAKSLKLFKIMLCPEDIHAMVLFYRLFTDNILSKRILK